MKTIISITTFVFLSVCATITAYADSWTDFNASAGGGLNMPRGQYGGQFSSGFQGFSKSEDSNGMTRVYGEGTSGGSVSGGSRYGNNVGFATGTSNFTGSAYQDRWGANSGSVSSSNAAATSKGDGVDSSSFASSRGGSGTLLSTVPPLMPTFEMPPMPLGMTGMTTPIGTTNTNPW